MKFQATNLKDAFVIEPEPRGDERGFFSRIYCDRELAEIGLDNRVVQINDSFSREAFTLRGLHFQLQPDSEIKVVRCIRGRLLDVIVDIRVGSPTFGKWFSVELSAENRLLLYVPRGFAHGFMTMEPETEMLYFVSSHYSPSREMGIRWNDPAIDIRWPSSPKVISEKDQKNPFLSELSPELLTFNK